MKTFELRTATGRCIARHVHLACSFRSRCLGLLSRDAMRKEEGLLLIPGGSIHTLGMRFPIDVVFLNRQMRILGLSQHVRPWRIRVAPKGTRRVLELAAGQIAAHGLKEGIDLIVDTDGVGKRDNFTRPTDPLAHMRTGPCERRPIQFSLRLPFRQHCSVPVREGCVVEFKRRSRWD
jgi:uncharacterized membrane protein (UPF0127 family)